MNLRNDDTVYHINPAIHWLLDKELSLIGTTDWLEHKIYRLTIKSYLFKDAIPGYAIYDIALYMLPIWEGHYIRLAASPATLHYINLEHRVLRMIMNGQFEDAERIIDILEEVKL